MATSCKLSASGEEIVIDQLYFPTTTKDNKQYSIA